MRILPRRLLTLLLFATSRMLADAPTWTSVDHGLGTDLDELNSVAFGNGVFVAIKATMTAGTLHYATSTDGTTWTARTITTTIERSGSAQRVRFLNDRFLIMPIGLQGSAGVALALTSTDGLSWTTANVGTTTTSPDEMDFGGGRVLAVGANGYFAASTDFSTWTSQSTSLQGSFGIQDVAYGNGRWFVTTNGAGDVATSADGIAFTKVNGLSTSGGFRVEYGNNVWFFYSQGNNAVSSDGVNFTTVTRTPNVTPGGTGNIRFVNGRFLSYGPSTFQASTDGQTWTNFGAFPSLGSGFVYSAINDFAYGNGKYVAVGARDFPATSALIFVADASSGSGGSDSGGDAGSYTLAFQLGVSALPGTTTPVTMNLRGYSLHNGAVAIAAPNAANTGTTVVQHKNGTLATLLDGTGGMPGGGNIQLGDFAGDGTVAYFLPRSTLVNGAFNGALLKLENGTFTTVIDNSHTVIDRGTYLASQFTDLSVANGAAAFLGRRGTEATYVFRRQGTTTSIVAQSGATSQPNGTGSGKFHQFQDVLMSADGRVFFDGYNEALPSSADFRRGIYVETNGAIFVVVDTKTLVPGTATPFKFGTPSWAVSPDGSKFVLRAGNEDYSSGTSEVHGVYLHANGALTRIVDTTMSIGGTKIDSITGDMAVTNEGTVFFYASVGSATGLYRASGGTIELFQDGGSSSSTRSPRGAWIHDGQVFFHAANASLQQALFRKPVAGSAAATEVLNLSTHPDFNAIDARAIEDLQFANHQVLLSVGAVKNGIQRSAILYGAASNVLGSSTPSDPAPRSQAVAAGGLLTLNTDATGTIQWQRNGAAVSGATSATLSIANMQPAQAGIYTAAIVEGGTTSVQSAIVGVSTTSKVIGAGREVDDDIAHPNGNTYDQLLLEGTAATFTADASQNQITRLSYIDLSNDIVQVEFSGPGTVSIALEGSSGPATPANYNQNVSYMKGHAAIVVAGATENTNLSIFSVGRVTAVNQSLFRDDVSYDGMADVAFVAIHSSNGKFGGLRTANASYWNTKGFTGVYAPGVEFTGPVYVGDIDAQENATPVLLLGAATDARVTGGNLEQANAAAVQVSGLTKLTFTAGTTSHGTEQAIKPTAGVLEENGTNVTSQIVVNPAGIANGGTGGASTGPITGPELTFFATASNPPYAHGTKKKFDASLTTLRFDSTTLVNPTPLTLNAPLTGARFTDPATGLVWEVYLRNGALHEINVVRSGQLVGQWSG